MLKIGLVTGTFFAGLSIILGAFGAHALKEQLSEYGRSIYEKGVFYQMFHSLAILLIAIVNQYVEIVDYSLPIWAGIIPIVQQIGTPEPDPKNLHGLSIPEHVSEFKIG